jgi:preprotein translocase subunit SecE
MADIEKVSEEVSEKEAKDTKKKASKSDKPGLGARLKKFFKDYKGELNKIVWYDRKSTFKSTGVVIVCLVVASAVISLIDLGLDSLITWIGTLA